MMYSYVLREKSVPWDVSLHCRVCLHLVVYVCAVLGQIFVPWRNCVNCEVVLYIVRWIVSCDAVPCLTGLCWGLYVALWCMTVLCKDYVYCVAVWALWGLRWHCVTILCVWGELVG